MSSNHADDYTQIFAQLHAALVHYSRSSGSDRISMKGLRDQFAQIVPRDDPLFLFLFSWLARRARKIDFKAGRKIHAIGIGSPTDTPGIDPLMVPPSATQDMSQGKRATPSSATFGSNDTFLRTAYTNSHPKFDPQEHPVHNPSAQDLLALETHFL
ncbi:hypothetical protein DFH28DRAFT_1107384 [Melampsora americana]|nr:hypothetical protein DFH28DRAFT_1107384 [Melampsora americana]